MEISALYRVLHVFIRNYEHERCAFFPKNGKLEANLVHRHDSLHKFEGIILFIAM